MNKAVNIRLHVLPLICLVGLMSMAWGFSATDSYQVHNFTNLTAVSATQRSDNGNKQASSSSSGKSALMNSTQNTKPKTIVVGLSSDYPPFEFKKHGELQGYDIDLVTAIAAELGAVVQFVDMDFSGLIPALNTNRIDLAVSGMTVTAERQQNVDFSRKYFSVQLDAISTQQNKLTSAQELAGKRLGAQLGSTLEQYAKTIPGASIIALTSNHQLIQELKIGRIDAIICEHVQALEFVKANPTLYAHGLGTAINGYAIALKKGSSLLVEVNLALNKLEATKKLDELNSKWIDVASDTK